MKGTCKYAIACKYEMGSTGIKNHSQKAKQDRTKPYSIWTKISMMPYDSNIQSSVCDISRNRND